MTSCRRDNFASDRQSSTNTKKIENRVCEFVEVHFFHTAIPHTVYIIYVSGCTGSFVRNDEN